MLPPNCLEQLVDFLDKNFVKNLRHDIKAFYFPPSPTSPKGGYFPNKLPVTKVDIERHLNGVQPLGLYTMTPEMDGHVMAAIVDLDDKEKKLTWEELSTTAWAISNQLLDANIFTWACRSGSGHGIHLWILWNSPQPAGLVRYILASAIAEVGPDCHIDIFPAQSTIGAGLGNLIALPLGRASRPLDLKDHSVIENLDKWIPEKLNYSFSLSPTQAAVSAAATHQPPTVKNVPIAAEWANGHDLSADERKGLQHIGEADIFGPVDPSALAEALTFINSDDYQIWIKYGLAIKAAVLNGQLSDDAGYKAWTDWSKSASGKYDDKTQNYEWGHMQPRAGGITLGTIWHDARNAGWKDNFKPIALLLPPLKKSSDNLNDYRMGGLMSQRIERTDNDDDQQKRHGPDMRWQEGADNNDITDVNRHFFIAMDMGKVSLFEETTDEDLNRYRLKRWGVNDFRVFYQNRMTVGAFTRTGVPVQKQLGETWLKSAFRRQYHEIVLRPEGSKPWQYNLWRGWTCKPSEEGSWDLLDHHIKNNVCSRDEGLYDYVMNWLALTFQKPNEPIGVALVLRGNRGTGKSSFVRAFGELFGQHFLHVGSSRTLTGPFNNHLRDCVFLFGDEAVWAGSRQDESILKTYITEPTITIEGKGRDAEVTRNRLHIVIATNHDWSVPAGPDERRFCCINVGNEQQQNTDYFKCIQRQLQEGGSGRLLWDMLNRNLDEFNVHHVPTTDELTQQKISSLTLHGKWWFHRLMEGSLHENTTTWSMLEPATLIYEDYVLFCRNSGNNMYIGSQENLAKQISAFLDKPVKTLRRLCRVKGREDRFTCWEFESLAACRANFTDRLRAEIIWSEPAEPENMHIATQNSYYDAEEGGPNF